MKQLYNWDQFHETSFKPTGISGIVTSFDDSTDCVFGKSSPETNDFPIKYGVFLVFGNFQTWFPTICILFLVSNS